MTRGSTPHHLETEQLLRYLDDDLSWIARRASRKHLAQCQRCGALAEEIRQVEFTLVAYRRDVNQLLQDAQPAEWKNGMRADLRRRLDSAAAALPAGFGAGRWMTVRLALAMILLACVALAVVAVRRWIAIPSHEESTPPSPAHVTAPPAPAVPARLRARPEAAALPAPGASGSPEVAALAALHRIGADLGEPVRIQAEPGDGVTVFCGEVAPDRSLEIRSALAAIPGIAFRMEPLAAARPVPDALTLAPQRTSLNSQLEAALGGAAAFQTVANSAVDEDEQLMAAAHALHNLDARFPAAREAALGAHDLAVLKEIRADLEESFGGHARQLLALIEPVRHALAAKGEAGGSGIFESAKRMDRVVLILFGGSPSGIAPGQLAAEFEGAARQLAAAAGVAQ